MGKACGVWLHGGPVCQAAHILADCETGAGAGMELGCNPQGCPDSMSFPPNKAQLIKVP